MLATRTTAVLAALMSSFMLAFSGLAFAQTPSDDAYSGVAAQEQQRAAETEESDEDEATGTRAKEGPSSGSLPFTGLELGFAALAGVALLGSGLVLRRISRPGTQP